MARLKSWHLAVVLFFLALGVLVIHSLLFIAMYWLRIPLPLLVPTGVYFLPPLAALGMLVTIIWSWRRLTARARKWFGGMFLVIAGLTTAFWIQPEARAAYDGIDKLHAWALKSLKSSDDELTKGDHLRRVRPEMLSGTVRVMAPTYVWVGENEVGVRYVVLDWGGGHVDATGLYLGPPSFRPRVTEESEIILMQDGVYRFGW